MDSTKRDPRCPSPQTPLHPVDLQSSALALPPTLRWAISDLISKDESLSIAVLLTTTGVGDR